MDNWIFVKEDEYGIYFKCTICGCHVLTKGLPPLQCPHCLDKKLNNH